MIKYLFVLIMGLGCLSITQAATSPTPTKTPVYKTVCLDPQPGSKSTRKKCVKVRVHKKFKNNKK